jgi:hypothetical protein
MNLYIMTRGRVNKQLTLATIPISLLRRTYLVVGEDEYDEHCARFTPERVIKAPSTVTNYSQKFQWLLDNGDHIGDSWRRKFVIMDDDLSFSYRDGPKLINTTDPAHIDDMWKSVELYLNNHALVGIHPRQMGHAQPVPFVLNSKIICIQAINKDMFPNPQEMPRVDQFPILADVLLNCYLLSHGYSNLVMTNYCQDHASCQAPGGCSIYRTPAMQREAVEYVASVYGPYAKAVVKKPKQAKWMGDERVDLTVQWKKMYAAGWGKRDGV